MRVTVIAAALAATLVEIVARRRGKPVGMRVRVIVRMTMLMDVRLDTDGGPHTATGMAPESMVLERQMERRQQRLHAQAQTDEDSEEPPHRVVPWFVPHSHRA